MRARRREKVCVAAVHAGEQGLSFEWKPQDLNVREHAGSLPKWPWNDKSFLQIRPERTAVENERLVRACTQESFLYGGAWLKLRDREFVVREAQVSGSRRSLAIGTWHRVGNLPALQCEQGSLVLTRVQVVSNRPMFTRSFVPVCKD